jgi:nucleotide-binding universal stress UspA family protein
LEPIVTIAKILAPVTGSDADAVVLATAFAMAKSLQAHVEVLFIHPDPREAVPVTNMPMSPMVIQELVDTAEELRKVAVQAAKAFLADAAGKANVRIVKTPIRSETVTASYREVSGHFPQRITDASRLSDLVVFPPMARADDRELHDGFVQVLTKSNRAVLLCGKAAPETIGTKVAIGWDGGVAAQHALVAAVPILQHASHVELLAVYKLAAGEARVSEAKEYLGLQGIKTSEVIVEKTPEPIGDTLLEVAMNDGCDLLVVGGYGHSQLRESIFGGVTADLASQGKLPVLMVH